jgi:hypothetical protein
MASTAAEREALEAVTLAQARCDADGIVRELRRHPLCAEVQAHGCQALHMLTKVDRDAIRNADGAAALEAVSQALRTHSTCANVQRTALYAMSALVHFAPTAQGHLMTLDAVIPVLDALHVTAADAEAVSHGCLVLGYLCIPDKSSLVKALDAGALELLAPALVAHAEDKSTVTNVLSMIGELALHSEAALERAINAGAVDAVISVMRTRADDAAVQEACCHFLCFMHDETTSAHAERAGASGVVEVLVAALRSNDTHTQQRSCEALFVMASTARASTVDRAIHAGVFAPLLRLLSTRAVPVETAANACGLLSNLLVVAPTMSPHACRLGAVEGVSATLRMRTHAHEQDG